MNHTTPTAALLSLYAAGETLLEFWSGGTPVHPHSDAAADFTAAMARSAGQARAAGSTAQTAARLVATIARMEPTEDADDNAATINRLISEARQIAPTMTAGDHIRAALSALPPLDFTGSVPGYLHNARRATLEQIAAGLAPAELSTNPAGEIAEMIDDDEAAGRLSDLARELWQAMTPEQRSEIIRARVNERP